MADTWVPVAEDSRRRAATSTHICVAKEPHEESMPAAHSESTLTKGQITQDLSPFQVWEGHHQTLKQGPVTGLRLCITILNYRTAILAIWLMCILSDSHWVHIFDTHLCIYTSKLYIIQYMSSACSGNKR